MNPEIVALFSLFSITILVVFLFKLYPDYRDDKFRQDMFTLRDELFDRAATGQLDFNHPIYGMLRRTMNGSIQYAHRMSLFDFLVRMVFVYDDETIGKAYNKRFEEAQETLNDMQRKLVIDIRTRMNFILLDHLIFKSVFLLVTIIVPVAYYLFARYQMERLLQFLGGLLNRLDSAALNIGRQRTTLINGC